MVRPCNNHPVFAMSARATFAKLATLAYRFVRSMGWRNGAFDFPLKSGSTAAREPDHANTRLVGQMSRSTARSYPWWPGANARSRLGTNALALDPTLAAATALLPTRCRSWQRVQFGRPVSKCRRTCGFFASMGSGAARASPRRSKIAHFRQSLGKVQP